MQNWRKMLLITTITLLIGGCYLFYVWNQRRSPGVLSQGAKQAAGTDDAVVLRALFIQHFDDTKQLLNTTLWMKNGAAIAFFPYVGGRIDFAHPAGLIPPTERMEVKKIVRSAVPAAVYDGIGHGDRQVFLVFARPGRTELFATPMGSEQGADEVYYCDVLYFYDDPRTIYDHWDEDVWKAIDAHTVVKGMSELQTRLSLGQKMHPGAGAEGNRTVNWDAHGKKWTVTFVNDRAATILSNSE